MAARRWAGVLFLLLVIVGGLAWAQGKEPLPQLKAYTVTSASFQVDTASETIVSRAISTEGLMYLSVTPTVQSSDNATVNCAIRVKGCDNGDGDVADVYNVASSTDAMATYATTGAQSVLWVQNLKPCRYLYLTATCSGAATNIQTVSAVFRGFRYGKGANE